MTNNNKKNIKLGCEILLKKDNAILYRDVSARGR